jgi:hypothetical protein
MDMDNLVEPWMYFSVCETIILKDCTGADCDLATMYSSKDS